MEPTPLLILAALLVFIGVIGTVLPVLPGVLLVFGGLFLAAYADGFSRVGVVGLSIIGALGLLSLGVDLLASLLGARRVGASPLALVGAGIGGVGGIFLGIPGIILGPFVGAAVGEFIAHRQLYRAGKVGFGTWIGLLLGAIAKVVIAFLMIGTFAAFYFFGR